MQIEAKFGLASRADYDKLIAVLEAPLKAAGKKSKVVFQRNNFFDGPGAPLAKINAICRLRLEADEANGRDSATIALKERSEVQEGSNVRYVCSETLTFVTAKKNYQTFASLIPEDGKVETMLRDHAGIQREQYATFTSLGGFDNERREYAWPGSESIQDGGLTLHVDRTTYPFGEQYEVEVPGITVPVHDVLSELSQSFTGIGVAHSYSEKSKFEVFRDGMAAVATQGPSR
jgi:hypothetical protein